MHCIAGLGCKKGREREENQYARVLYDEHIGLDLRSENPPKIDVDLQFVMASGFQYQKSTIQEKVPREVHRGPESCL
jgi:hypothetical protein